MTDKYDFSSPKLKQVHKELGGGFLNPVERITFDDVAACAGDREATLWLVVDKINTVISVVNIIASRTPKYPPRSGNAISGPTIEKDS